MIDGIQTERRLGSSMLPPKKSKPEMVRSSVYASEDTLLRAQAIADEEGVKSRNLLLNSFLAFAVDLFPHLKPLRAQIEAYAEKESKRTGREISYAAAIALLVEKGLKAAR